MTSLLDIVRAVDSAPSTPDHTLACEADPLLCPTCGGDGKPTPTDLHIAAELGNPAPTACAWCRGTGRRNCDRCGVRPADRCEVVCQYDVCALCDMDNRDGDPCATCGAPVSDPGLLHYPCGGLFCSARCAVDPRHTCDIDRSLDEEEDTDDDE